MGASKRDEGVVLSFVSNDDVQEQPAQRGARGRKASVVALIGGLALAGAAIGAVFFARGTKDDEASADTDPESDSAAFADLAGGAVSATAVESDVVWGRAKLNLGNKLEWVLRGLEQNSQGTVHLHTGKSCDDVGPSLWYAEAGVNPWTSVAWSSNHRGKSTGTVEINDLVGAYSFAGNLKHAVVFYSEAEEVLACGILNTKSSYRKYGVRSSLNGGFAVHHGELTAGEVILSEKNKLSWGLYNLGANQVGALEVLAGRDCSDPSNTWLSMEWQSNAYGVSEGDVSLGVDEYDFSELVDRAVTIRDADGAVVVCDMLSGFVESTTEALEAIEMELRDIEDTIKSEQGEVTPAPTQGPSRSFEPTIPYEVTNPPTNDPTAGPVVSPTMPPTLPPVSPTPVPTDAPVITPTTSVPPTPVPTDAPVITPTTSVPPTPVPTDAPVITPTTSVPPTPVPTDAPVITPTTSVPPTPVPTDAPVITPTTSVPPTPIPTDAPVITPTTSVPPTPVPTESTVGSTVATIEPFLGQGYTCLQTAVIYKDIKSEIFSLGFERDRAAQTLTRAQTAESYGNATQVQLDFIANYSVVESDILQRLEALDQQLAGPQQIFENECLSTECRDMINDVSRGRLEMDDVVDTLKAICPLRFLCEPGGIDVPGLDCPVPINCDSRNYTTANLYIKLVETLETHMSIRLAYENASERLRAGIPLTEEDNTALVQYSNLNKSIGYQMSVIAHFTSICTFYLVSPSGTVSLNDSGLLKWDLQGPIASHSGTIKIHEVTTCDPNNLGDVYSAPGTTPFDTITWTGSSLQGNVSLSDLEGALTFEDYKNHAVVIYDPSDAIQSCGILN